MKDANRVHFVSTSQGSQKPFEPLLRYSLQIQSTTNPGSDIVVLYAYLTASACCKIRDDPGKEMFYMHLFCTDFRTAFQRDFFLVLYYL